jgi:hypothetical protein
MPLYIKLYYKRAVYNRSSDKGIIKLNKINFNTSQGILIHYVPHIFTSHGLGIRYLTSSHVKG